MRNTAREALGSLHDIVESLSGILHKLSEKKEPVQEVQTFKQSFESLKEYFEKLSHEEHPPPQDLGIDALSNKRHLTRER